MTSARTLVFTLLGLAALALAGMGALRAQDGAAETATAPDTPSDATLAPEPAPGERLSADNNISFPVDI